MEDSNPATMALDFGNLSRKPNPTIYKYQGGRTNRVRGARATYDLGTGDLHEIKKDFSILQRSLDSI
jgi:hypothetical protein